MVRQFRPVQLWYGNKYNLFNYTVGILMLGTKQKYVSTVNPDSSCYNNGTSAITTSLLT